VHAYGHAEDSCDNATVFGVAVFVSRCRPMIRSGTT
jgi:hypothetical protein